MPRPRLASHERRDFRLPAPVMTGQELAFVEAQAAAAGISLAEYVRRRVLGHRVTPARPLADAQLLTEINRIGVNLNQVNRRLQATGQAPEGLLAAIAAVQAAMLRVASHGS